MCGRYTLATDIEAYLAEIGIRVPAELRHPRHYNIAPSQPVVGLVADPGLRLEVMEWGYLPGWAKPENDLRPVINARAEGVAEKPFFRGAFRSSRCALLADGFYEWKKEGREKHPYRIRLKDGGVFALAGLWSFRHEPDGSEHATCAIITTEPNRLMEDSHNRMPVILNPSDLALWLDPKAGSKDLLSLLDPYPATEMEAYEVSRLVNSPTNDTPACIESIAE